MRRENWLTGAGQRISRPALDDRNWLIDLQVQIGVQDMERDAATIAARERDEWTGPLGRL